MTSLEKNEKVVEGKPKENRPSLRKNKKEQMRKKGEQHGKCKRRKIKGQNR
jgi:hypothetical protein